VSYAGASFVIFGKTTGFASVFNVSGLDGLNGFRIDSFGLGDLSGSSVSGGGDVNGDGIADVVIGAKSSRAPHGIFGVPTTRVGAAFVLFGRAVSFDPVISLSSVEGPFGFRFEGRSTDERLHLVSFAGDINGDHFTDLIVGSPKTDPNGKTDAGSSYVVFGRPTRTVTFTDVDGDSVTVKVSQGTLKPDNFKMSPAGTFHGGVFTELDLSRDGVEFAGADVAIIAEPGPSGGDGMVNLGFLNAGGIDFGKVTIDGNLGHAEAGAVIKLEASSLGTSDAPTIESNFDGNVGVLKIKASVSNSVIHVNGDLERLLLGMNLEGSTITVLGDLVPADGQAPQSIDRIMIGANVDHSQLLVGYNAAGDAVNADARVGQVRVAGDWMASDFIVGAAAGPDNLFGTDDDVLVSGGSSIIPRVASIVIKGSAAGTADETDHYGIVAEYIGGLRVGAMQFPFMRGPRNDLGGFDVGTTFDLTAREVT
jgi:hypothetical protein